MLKYKKVLIIASLILLEICTIFLGYKSYSNKTLDKVEEKNEVNKK